MTQQAMRVLCWMSSCNGGGGVWVGFGTGVVGKEIRGAWAPWKPGDRR